MYKNLRGSIILLITAMIWGFAFVAQSAGLEKVGPFTFQASRMVLAAAVLIPTAVIFDVFSKHRAKKAESNDKKPNISLKKTIAAGSLCGILLFAAASLQQIGIGHTSVGHAGFLTALYILIVPIMGIFAGRKLPFKLWFCIIISLIGLYLLCMTEEGFSMSKGDILVTASAFFFSLHIITVDTLARGADSLKLSAVQMSVAAVLSLIFMFIFERPAWSDISGAWFSIFYAGVMSCGVAYTLQIAGQKYARPAVASIIMSLEAVFSVIGGAIILSQIPTATEIAVCIMVFSATVISQLPNKKP
ncbi:MAG: DMT family transporter, partial [Eubacteriales bacterium]